MKNIKKFLILFTGVFLLPLFVRAGEIRFNEPVKTSKNTYEFTLTIDNIRLNSIAGEIHVTNGTITKVTMSSSWINKTGTNSKFYFYRNGASTGSYKVATIEVTMTDNSEYKVSNLDYKNNKCVKDNYGNYFGEAGTLVSKATYDATCSISKDATLKSISPNVGTLSPKFESSLELYSLVVENNISSIKWNPITSSSKAKIVSGSTCSLKVGINLCKILVQAEAGNQKIYTITVTRKNTSNTTLSTDASISNLKVHGGVLTSSFSANKKEYDVKVDKNTKSIYFTFVTNSNKQSMTSKPCSITEDTKTCKLTITAEDGKTKNSYLFTILHEGQTNSTTNNNSSSNNSNNTPSSSTNSSFDKKSNTNQNTASNSEIKTDINTEINSNPSVPNENEAESNNPIQNDNNHQEEIKKEEKKNTIKIPFINKEMNKNIFFGFVAVVDLILGIGIGIFIAKHNKKRK